jgi:hypothetical protein
MTKVVPFTGVQRERHAATAPDFSSSAELGFLAAQTRALAEDIRKERIPMQFIHEWIDRLADQLVVLSLTLSERQQ